MVMKPYFIAGVIFNYSGSDICNFTSVSSINWKNAGLFILSGDKP